MGRARYNRDAILPSEAPLAMPEQTFDRRVTRSSDPQNPDAWIPRAALAMSTAIATTAFAYELYRVLSPDNITPLQVVFLILATLSFAWIALGTLSSVLGFLHLYAGKPPKTIELPDKIEPLNAKTALLFPIYKEAPASIAGTIEALADDLASRGCERCFDVFVLSDTPDEIARAQGAPERKTFAALRRRLARRMEVYYRRRPMNTGRKSGNIQDWVERYGARYDHFVILDADSVMSAPTLIRLAHAMVQNPKTGLIQTVPKLAGARTLLQYLQQFASNIYGPAAAAGLAAWHGAQGNYWGHNAIIRTKAFAGAAGLPVLRGNAPFGGHIQSHDFVEAALLHRAGWAVHMAPTATGSYEGAPPALPDLVTRDRRWAQGNLQHINIARTRGLTPMGRTHLIFGAASYLVALAWAASIIVGVLLALQGQQMIPTYFKDEKTLFPIWPITDPGPSLRLFLATVCIVLLPKLLGGALELRRVRHTRERGGTLRAVTGISTETVFSMLLAPILMVTQTRAVLEILLGRDSGWNSQIREGQTLKVWHAMKLFWLPCLIGIALTATCMWVSLELVAWMSPILVGIVFAGPLAWFTAQPARGFLRLALSTPEDRSQPSIMTRTARLRDRWAGESVSEPVSPDTTEVATLPRAA